MCPEEHMQTFVFERKSLKFQVFRKSNEVCATVAKIFLQVCQNWKECPEEQFKEKPFSKVKKILIF